ncbi:hypothetical protein ABIC90_003003 [Variovorax boronicumulans]
MRDQQAVIETGNESYRFRHSTHEAKGRIKTREQTRKAAAAQVSETTEEEASPDGSDRQHACKYTGKFPTFNR